MRKKNKSDFKKKDWDNKDFSKKKKSNFLDKEKDDNKPFSKWKKDNPNFSKSRNSSDRNRNSGRFDEEKSSNRPFSKWKKDNPKFSKDRNSGSDRNRNSGRFDEEKSSNRPFSKWKKDSPRFSKDGSRNRNSNRFEGDKNTNKSFGRWKRDNPNFSKNKNSDNDRGKSSDRFEDRKSSGKYGNNFSKKEGSYKAYKQRGSDKLSKFSRFEKKKVQPVIKDNPTLDELAAKGMRLNKYVSNSGICSRRKADDFIKAGKVKVNNKIVLEMGHRVQKDDVVTFEDKVLNPESKVYVLLNKPKDMITTTEDPQGRPTVMDIVNNASEERLYPVGRLDRGTTGLLLLSNDGELAQRLTHPSFEMKKIYHVFLDKLLTKADFKKIAAGLVLEDGFVPIDQLAYPNPDDHKEVGIEIHVGRNRIVRRIFESLGYKVKRLDRVIYGPLTKKDLPRGKWRYLSEKEVVLLKHFQE